MALDQMTSDQMLDLLATMGRPRLVRHDDGRWSAGIKFPAPEGVTTEVNSDYNHPTHRSALLQVIARVRDLTGLADVISRELAKIPGRVVVKQPGER